MFCFYLGTFVSFTILCVFFSLLSQCKLKLHELFAAVAATLFFVCGAWPHIFDLLQRIIRSSTLSSNGSVNRIYHVRVCVCAFFPSSYSRLISHMKNSKSHRLKMRQTILIFFFSSFRFVSSFSPTHSLTQFIQMKNACKHTVVCWLAMAMKPRSNLLLYSIQLM